MYAKYGIPFLLLAALLTACNLTLNNPTTPAPPVPTLPPTTLPLAATITATLSPLEPTSAVIQTSAASLSPQHTIINRAFEVVAALKSQDMVSLSSYIHPVNGVRFSPYAFVMETDQLFTAEQIATMPADSQVYSWGEHAGSGEPIDLGFMDYMTRFVYDVDFANAPQISLNRPLSYGSSIDNSAEFYPGSNIVEFYFPGFDPQYEGMDWRSLRLVFTEYDGTWYLAGVIHDQWTP